MIETIGILLSIFLSLIGFVVALGIGLGIVIWLFDNVFKIK